MPGTSFARLREVVRSTSFRLGLLQAGVFILAVGLLVGFVARSTEAWLNRALDQDIQDDLQELADEAKSQGIDAVARRIERLLTGPEPSSEFYLLLDRNGHRLAGNAPAAPPGPGWFEMPLSTAVSHRGRPKNREHVLRGRAMTIDDGALLAVGRDLWAAGQITEVIWRGFLVYLVATSVIALVLSLLAGLYVRRRIEAVSRTAREIMAGDLGRRIAPSPRRDEFDRLAAQLNAMLDRIGELMDDIRQVTNDIAHDLRTPLARLRQRLETAHRKASSADEYASAVEAAIAETDTLLATFTAMLRIAQIEAGTRRAGFAPVDLSRLLTSLADTYAAVAEDLGQSLAASVEPGITVPGDPDLLNQLVVNLIENALTHSPTGSHVALSLLSVPEGVILIVADDGPGIPAAMRERVLKRFVRLEGARSTPGSGLGLASVAAIARLHGIALALDDNHPGLRVTLRFARAKGP